MIKCDICGKKFNDKKNLGTHIKLTHQKDTVKKPEPIHCQLCDKLIGAHAWGLHVKRIHHITVKDYYDTYIKQPNEGLCINCGKPTTFYSMTQGYAQTCSQLCQKQHVWDNMTDIQRKKANEKNSESVKTYIKNRSKEETLAIHRKMRQNSQSELSIIDTITSVYSDEVLRNVKRKIYIYPYELDIVIPKLKLAIEYNGCYFHSTYSGKSKDYHLMKSLLCREKGIRLIHIYEFEDFEQQKQLLKDLILGIDNYPKNDFNKNNLIKSIPKPKIIYDDGRLVIYGAGELL